jgi:hypothetical protein
MIYSLHGTDCYEDIFRDYNYKYIEEKIQGVEIALNELNNIS